MFIPFDDLRSATVFVYRTVHRRMVYDCGKGKMLRTKGVRRQRTSAVNDTELPRGAARSGTTRIMLKKVRVKKRRLDSAIETVTV